jgi:uncharacterized integral membrane protein
MQIVFLASTLVLLAVAIFAFQNPDPVTIRFLAWRTSSSLAVVTVAATASGAFIACLIGFATRLRRWRRDRTAARSAREIGVAASIAKPVISEPTDRA